ncbi:hypothetical protein AJ79_05440 [Helicocarpus griseus UAMH5409]|uniref:Uncharacterized protein n=1 Tax=Helicocarpus griseus UAMH5409 TaxID=1447875 RepID=A0A2B7XPF0_9EURO|nr:hypothetical protein AJ79_05440 [Helicocarpus griseus UAMH5409]
MVRLDQLPNELIQQILSICSEFTLPAGSWFIHLRCVSRTFEANTRHVVYTQWRATRKFHSWWLMQLSPRTLNEKVTERPAAGAGAGAQCSRLVNAIRNTCDYITALVEGDGDYYANSPTWQRYGKVLCDIASRQMDCEELLETLLEENDPCVLVEVDSVMRALRGVALIAAVYERDMSLLTALMREGNIQVNIDHRYFGNALIMAAKDGNGDAVRAILAYPGRKMICGLDYYNGLHWAIIKGYLSIVEMFLQQPDVDVNARGAQDKTPLIIATCEGHPTITLRLLDHRDIRPGDFDRSNRDALFWATLRGYEDVAEIVLDKLPDLESCSDTDELPVNIRKLFIMAATHGSYGIIQMLLRKYPFSVNHRGYQHKPPLLNAAENGYNDIMKLLLDRTDSDPSHAAVHRYALSLAAENGHPDAVTLLLTHEASAGQVYKNRHDALHQAASRGKGVSVIRMLLEDRDDIDVNHRSIMGQSALIAAAFQGQSDIVKYLLSKRETDVNLADRRGRTALSYAAHSGRERVVELLLAYEKILPDKADLAGLTPLALALAVRRNHTGVVSMLMERDGVDVNAANKQGTTPLSYAREHGLALLQELERN